MKMCKKCYRIFFVGVPRFQEHTLNTVTSYKRFSPLLTPYDIAVSARSEDIGNVDITGESESDGEIDGESDGESDGDGVTERVLVVGGKHQGN